MEKNASRGSAERPGEKLPPPSGSAPERKSPEEGPPALLINARPGAGSESTDEVLGWVAHELKTPLAAAIMTSTLLEREMQAAGAPGETLRRHQMLTRQLARIDHLTNAILDYARLRASGRPLAARPVRLGTVLAESLDFYRELHPTRELRGELEAPELVVEGDPELLRQIIDNLISNALRHGGARARVRVSLGREETLAVVRVSDDGPGLDHEGLRRLVEGKAIAEGPAQRSGGLGLHIAESLARMHHAQLAVTSAPGEGTTFTLRMPLVPGAG